ncbi:MAG TPA: response regulator, partial [Gemmata sp.]|nr:response regulator [Gemmata sp.]
MVDDSQLEQRYVGKLLASFNECRVSFARNGEEALTAVAKEPPAAVLTDLHLPKLDGLSFVEKMRERFPLVPVVLMTASGSERVAVDALRAGAADYVPKQALAHDLAPVLERVLALRQAEHRRFRVLAGMTRRSSQFVL